MGRESFARGVVMPVWLRLVGVDAAVPSLAAWSLVGHLVRGVTLCAVYSLVLSADVPSLRREGGVVPGPR